MKDTRAEFYTGHVLDVSPDVFEDDSVDLVAGSPPYWGLRDYGKGTDAIWGGDGECVHEWNNRETKFGSMGGGKNGRKEVWNPDMRNNLPDNSICHLCGAWKGQLGLEPTWQLYVEHLVIISREIKRILKPTGSYYLVLGDTYAGSGCGAHDYRDDTSTGVLRKRHRQRYQKLNPQVRVGYDSITRVKQKLDIPGKVITAHQEDGWTLRNKIIWHKNNHMPESVKDRFTRSYEEILFLVDESKGYHFDLDSVREPFAESSIRRVDDSQVTTGNPDADWGFQRKISHVGKNPGDVWRINTAQFPLDWCPVCKMNLPKRDIEKRESKFFHKACNNELLGHFAVFPEALIEPIIKSSCPPHGVVLDPFCGSGTTNLVAMKLGRKSYGIDINPDYINIAKQRCRVDIASLEEFGE